MKFLKTRKHWKFDQEQRWKRDSEKEKLEDAARLEQYEKNRPRTWEEVRTLGLVAAETEKNNGGLLEV